MGALRCGETWRSRGSRCAAARHCAARRACAGMRQPAACGQWHAAARHGRAVLRGRRHRLLTGSSPRLSSREGAATAALPPPPPALPLRGSQGSGGLGAGGGHARSGAGQRGGGAWWHAECCGACGGHCQARSPKQGAEEASAHVAAAGGAPIGLRRALQGRRRPAARRSRSAARRCCTVPARCSWPLAGHLARSSLHDHHSNSG